MIDKSAFDDVTPKWMEIGTIMVLPEVQPRTQIAQAEAARSGPPGPTLDSACGIG